MPASDPEPGPVPAPPSPPPIDIRARLARLEGDEIPRLEEEFEARLLEDPAFAKALFDAFLSETDPSKLSFLQNILAGDPRLRNSAEWQERFMNLAETDLLRERRITALLFIQQAETIRAVRDRLFTLAQTGGELRANALIALKGLPGHRMADADLSALAARIADAPGDPHLRGLALRIEDNPAHAAPFLADPERLVRLQAVVVMTSPEPLEAALASETDPEVRELIEVRLSQFK
jgi:truncated hemoglobin YjbI